MSYELPFGKNRKWINQSRLADLAVGGWELTWTQTLQSGLPFTVGFANSPNRYLPGGTRPDILTTNQAAYAPDWALGPNRFPTSAQNPYLNYSSFAYPAAFTPGTLGRNTFIGPGLNWTQLSLAKWFHITERLRAQIRMDANNFPFKQPQFSNPSSSYDRNSPLSFAKMTGTRGAFSDIGTANANLMIIFKVQF